MSDEVRRLLKILAKHTRTEKNEKRKTAMTTLRNKSEKDREEAGFAFVKYILRQLTLFHEADEKDKDRRPLMQTIDTNYVVMNGAYQASPCTHYLEALEYHVNTRILFMKFYIISNNMTSGTPHEVCEAFKELLINNRAKILAWTQALKAGFVMPALNNNLKSFPVVNEILDNVWELIEDFEDLWK